MLETSRGVCEIYADTMFFVVSSRRRICLKPDVSARYRAFVLTYCSHVTF